MKVDLEELCRLLRTRFSLDQLNHMRQNLALDDETLRLTATRNRAHLAVFLVGSLHKQNRVPELLELCDEMHKDFSKKLLLSPFNLTTWEYDAELSDRLVRLINKHLGFKGAPYVIQEPIYNPDSGWAIQHRETGCFKWSFSNKNDYRYQPDDFGAITEKDPLWNVLAQLKEAIQGNQTIAYLGYQNIYNPEGIVETRMPIIIVAPSADPFDAVRIEQPGDGNVDLDTKSWLKILHYLDKKYGIEIISVTVQYIEVKIRKKLDQRSIPALKRYLYEKLCAKRYLPDFIEEITAERLQFPIRLMGDD